MTMGSETNLKILLWRKLLLLLVLTRSINCSYQAKDHGHPKGKQEQINFHPDYWTKLQQAIKYAKCLENQVLPTLDNLSLIMKPASCHKETKPNEVCNTCIKEANSVNVNTTTIQPHEVNFRQFADLPKPKFHCTSHNGVSANSPQKDFETYFRMEYSGIHPPKSLGNDDIPRVFVVEKEVDGKWEAVINQLFWFFPLETKKHSTYRIRVTAVSPRWVYAPQLSDHITLFDTPTQVIGKPKNFRVVETQVDRTAARVGPLMTLRWESGSGQNASCDFDVFYMDDEEYKVERSKAEEAFWVVLDKIDFERDYNIHLMEKFGYARESQRADLHVTIKSCLELQNFSFDSCPPPPPSGIRVEEETSSSFKILWDRFKQQNATNRISTYEITVERLPTSNDAATIMYKSPQIIFQQQVPGNQHFVEIQNVTVQGLIRITIMARSKGGKSHEEMLVHQLNGDASWTKTLEKFWVVILILVLIILSVGVIFYLKGFRDRLQRNREKKEKWKRWDEEIPSPRIDRYSSKWEIDFQSLVLHHVVGRGQFGEVRKATLYRRGKKITVAVKTLRKVPPESHETEDDNSEDGTLTQDIIEKFFREEFEILKGIGSHKHVVGLVGIVKDPAPSLVVEFCDGGDLQSHLRKAALTRLERKRCLPSTSASAMSSTAQLQANAAVRVQLSMVTNEAYFMTEPEECRLTPQDLLSYARQIACGCEFLSSNKIIHRDLAARNILISGKNRVLKIADFGLSRDVYEQNWYKKRSNGKIPIKWLAIECLMKEVYTTKSDVWSYGIVLWEIVTFGATPYPGIDNHKIYDVLKDGYRMTKPDNCSTELYNLMKRCWTEHSHERPDFSTIRRKIEELIGNGEAVYLNLDSTGTVQYTELESMQGSLVSNG